MIKQKLLITLQPTDYYFFGGEITFDAHNSDRSQNYFVRSNPLPQQTALVGLVRHILYEEKEDIGDESFIASQTVKQDFGVLKSISPLMLQQVSDGKERFLLPASKLFLEKNEIEIKVDFEKGKGMSLQGNSVNAAPELSFLNQKKKETEIYTSKEQLGKFWVFLDTGEKLPEIYFCDEDKKEDNKGIIIPSTHIGINKMDRMKAQKKSEKEKGDEENEAFYKQIFYRLRLGFRFAFIVELESKETDLIKCFNTSMPFGGEGRTFIVRATEWKEDQKMSFDENKTFGNYTDRIVLTSDAWVQSYDDLMELCRFAVTSTVPFRNIQINKKDYAQAQVFDNLHKKKKDLYYLIEKGSVLFPFPEPGKMKALQKVLDDSENFQNIGYNHYFPNKII